MSRIPKPENYFEYQCDNCSYIMSYGKKQDNKVICPRCNNKVSCNSDTEVRSISVKPVEPEPVEPPVG